MDCHAPVYERVTCSARARREGEKTFCSELVVGLGGIAKQRMDERLHLLIVQARVGLAVVQRLQLREHIPRGIKLSRRNVRGKQLAHVWLRAAGGVADQVVSSGGADLDARAGLVNPRVLECMVTCLTSKLLLVRYPGPMLLSMRLIEA